MDPVLLSVLAVHCFQVVRLLRQGLVGLSVLAAPVGLSDHQLPLVPEVLAVRQVLCLLWFLVALWVLFDPVHLLGQGILFHPVVPVAQPVRQGPVVLVVLLHPLLQAVLGFLVLLVYLLDQLVRVVLVVLAVRQVLGLQQVLVVQQHLGFLKTQELLVVQEFLVVHLFQVVHLVQLAQVDPAVPVVLAGLEVL